MKFKRGEKFPVAAPGTVEYAAFKRACETKTDQNEIELSRLLGALTVASESAPTMSASIHDYDMRGIGHSRLRCKPLRIARFMDGFALAGAEVVPDGHLTHRVIVKCGSEPFYARCLTTDSQDAKDRYPATTYVGLEAIAEDELAMSGVRLLDTLADEHRLLGWPHAYRLEDLGVHRITRHEPLIAAV